MDAENEWKKSVGFPINFSPENSDHDFDDVVMRPGRGRETPRGGGGGGLRQTERMLADEGDGSEADLLGTTPPRVLRRNNHKRKTMHDAMLSPRVSKDVRDACSADRPRNRLSLKIQRSRDRDWKQGGCSSRAGAGGERADSLPPHPAPPAPPADARNSLVPTLKWPNLRATNLVVESCNRFMSLSSRLKCRGVGGGCEQSDGEEGGVRRRGAGGAPPSRVSFHNTFSMLINMGNSEKGCRRTISREEQVWQNELKDLIWLELQARIAGRSLAEQDSFLCAQRDIVPAVLSNIWNYRFVNPHLCEPGEGEAGDKRDSGAELDDDEGSLRWCGGSLGCGGCSRAVGKALRELGALLDGYHRALALYPSSHALTADHKLVATLLFQNRLKAMCLWYNTAMHMRLKVIAVRQLVRSLRRKQRRRLAHHASMHSRQSSTDSSRPCAVRFNLSTTPSSSNTSNNSEHNDHKEEGNIPTDNKEDNVPADIKEEDSVTDNNEGEGNIATDNKDESEHNDKKEKECDDTDDKEEGNANSDSNKENDAQFSSGETGRDETDSCDKNIERGTAASTPEIVLDSRYGTADTSESGYTSAGEGGEGGEPADDVFELGALTDLAELRLLGRAPVSIYRSYHQEMLKTQGVRRCMLFINKMRHNLLHKVTHTLEKPTGPVMAGEAAGEGRVFEDAGGGGGAGGVSPDADDERTQELRRYGCLSEECLSMRLPSYRNHFLLLCCVCMEAAHDYLSLRLEECPKDPSCLTVKQLIHELKEGLDIATDMRAAFARNIHVALAGQGAGGGGVRGELLQVVRCFDHTVDTVLKQYLSYLMTMSAVEQLGRASLQAEWDFTARLAQRVPCAAARAPQAFAEIACNQLDNIRKQIELKQKQLQKLEKRDGDSDKQYVYTICRAVQQVYASERDSAVHCAHWARRLAARLARAPPPAYAAERANIAERLMLLRDMIVSQTREILERARESSLEERDAARDVTRDAARDVTRDADREALGARVRELLLQIYRLGFELHKELYRFAQAPFEPERETRDRPRPVSLQPVRRVDARERRRRPETIMVHESTNPLIHKELHRFVFDSLVSDARRSPAGGGAARGGGGGRPRLLRGESVLEEGDADNDRLLYTDHQTQSSIELFLQGETPPPPAPPSPPPDPAGGAGGEGSEADARLAETVARAVIEFAQCWMSFVVERCEKGRGLRPRWACQGLEFLMLACDPSNTRHLTDAEFERLKQQMDGCISHVIGCRPAAPRPAPPDSPLERRRPRIHSPHPCGAGAGGAGGERGAAEGGVPPPPSPPAAPDPLFQLPCSDNTEHSRPRRVLLATQALDLRRSQQLVAARAVGRVLDTAVNTYEPKLRQLKFKWQRGLKIGAGTFGKVYTVVNTETGQLLAMKEISLGAGDRRALQRAANELRVLEGVIHPHLVRYYGCELHREEMLLFMELCVEGSLEALVATAGALSEPTARRYTKQLLAALAELHARQIAHRDVKSGNIFLTNEGHCLKLGDFGCAVKIRAHSTAQGELVGHVGTQAYMAPEVFMKSTGHGRAADIWSLGCVVTEMASGKRPFSEYDSNVQIMFVVGMGGRPEIPDALSGEGQEFCRACLTHEPEQRPTAEQLASHHFLKLKADEECQCEPAFLIT